MKHEPPPEQQVVNYLDAAGYKPDTIIQYLEAQVEKEWGRDDFAECGPGEKMTFGVCRKIGEAPDSEPGEQKPEKQDKSGMEDKLEKAAKTQGSDPTNNRKVMIDGKAYGWAIQGGKPIMVEWGSVAGAKKVGSGGEGAKGGKKPEETAGNQNRKKIETQIKTQEANLAKQVNDAGRQAIQKVINELKSKLGG
jgi:hypothetical protein